jgi:phage baseplate assembly protein gpV
MATSFVEQAAKSEPPQPSHGYAIACGVVTDNLNILMDAKVKVRIPSLPDFETWARVVSVGGGSSRGFMWLPQVDDEVLVAFNEHDNQDCYILGGLWNTEDRPPTSIPTDFTNKRILKTGLAGGLGHTVEFDDLLQSITITSSTKQVVSIDPKSISISTTEGALSVSLDLAATPPGITVQTKAGNITLSAPAGKISIQGLQVEVVSTSTLDLKGTGPTTIVGLPVKIN